MQSLVPPSVVVRGRPLSESLIIPPIQFLVNHSKHLLLALIIQEKMQEALAFGQRCCPGRRTYSFGTEALSVAATYQMGKTEE